MTFAAETNATGQTVAARRTDRQTDTHTETHRRRATQYLLRSLKRSAQVQCNYNTTAVQEFFLYCICIALVRSADRFKRWRR